MTKEREEAESAGAPARLPVCPPLEGLWHDLWRDELIKSENMSKSFTIHDLPAEERPRERLVKFGEQALSAQELLQVILGRGIAGESVAVTSQTKP
ncbi:MAG: hypothetical protein Q8P01_05190 [bacterium]|nr:hypothetical protein [bacterium]